MEDLQAKTVTSARRAGASVSAQVTTLEALEAEAAKKGQTSRHLLVSLEKSSCSQKHVFS